MNKIGNKFCLSRRSFGKLSLAASAAYSLKGFGALATPAADCRLRIGILSDIHLLKMEDSEHFRRALKWFDAQKVDGIVISGDLGFNGLIREMKVVSDVWYEIFPNDCRSDGAHVEKLFITGNHDVDGYFYHQKDFPKVRFPADPETAKDSFVFNRERVWRDLFHEDYAPVMMKTVKGYRFVLHNWYPRLAADVCRARWLAEPPDTEPYRSFRREPQALASFFAAHGDELKGEKPFFFVQHNHPGDTVFSPFLYGSPQGWGGHDCGVSTKILKNYPNCVAFSGHTHVTLVDERAIWQGDFTSIDASSCPGLSMAGAIGGRANMNWDADQESGTKFDRQTPKAGLLMRVYDDRIVLERREFSHNQSLGDDWIVPWPIARDKPYAYDRRTREAVVPEFPKGTKLVREETDEQIVISFPTVRRENAGVRALDYEVTVFETLDDVTRIVDQRRFYSQGIGLNETNDRAPVRLVYRRKDLTSSEIAKLSFEVRPCDAWGHKGAPLSIWTA